MDEEKILNLPLRKKHALEIIKGEKVREYRAFTDHWASRLCLFEDETDKYMATDVRKFEKIHFYPYNNKWHLDVEVKNIGWYTVDEQMIKDLSGEVELPPVGEQIFIINLGKVLSTDLTAE